MDQRVCTALVVLLALACRGEPSDSDTESVDTNSDTDIDAACAEVSCPDHMTCVVEDDAPWCLPDADADGVPDADDNCPHASNPNQLDTDGDLLGEACDLCPGPNELSPCGDPCCDDPDGDGIPGTDNCPYLPNAGQEDADGDLVGDACDLCEASNPLSPCGDACLDSDGDDVSDFGHCEGDATDTCPNSPSTHHEDDDGDGLEDVCDPDGVAPLQSARLDRRRTLLRAFVTEGALDPATAALALS